MRNNEFFKKSTTGEPRQDELGDRCVSGGLGAGTEYLAQGHAAGRWYRVLINLGKTLLPWDDTLGEGKPDSCSVFPAI